MTTVVNHVATEKHMNVAQARTARIALRGAGMCMRCLVRAF
ncbi:hypothetical protein [Actinomyces sp. oral taxon 170]|nr:hypothetical protein [Actinomyces sp. oral taxon 170]